MLEFKQNDTAVALILTLTELVSIPSPFYLFVFTHVTTKDVVAFIKSDDDDESDFPERYNQFTINPSDVFENMQSGEWQYKVSEQDNDTNLDPALSGSIIEQGKMILDRAIDFSFTQYDNPVSYKEYNG